jgi:hypothetical protein
MSMCKFDNIEDDNYNKVHAVISGYVREIKGSVCRQSGE